MKMSKVDYEKVTNAFESQKEIIASHYEAIKKSDNYNNLGVLIVRVAWDACRHALGTKFILDQYEKGLNDSHVQTAIVKALKKIMTGEVK